MQRIFLTSVFLLLVQMAFSAEPDTARIAISIQKPDSAQSVAEKLFSALEIKTRFATYNLYPAIGYDPSSGVELGMMPIITLAPRKKALLDAQYRPSTIFTRVTYSTKNWLGIFADFKIFTPSQYVINNLLELQNIPETFYGIGYQSGPELAASYQSFRVGMRGDASRSFFHAIQFGVKYDFQYATVTDVTNELLNSSVTGFDGGMIAGLGPIVSFDSRDDADYPLRGSFLSASSVFFPAINTHEYKFVRSSLDLRKYYNPINDFVVAFQAFGEFTNGNAPFYALPRLAGKDRLRGFAHRSKFVDNNVVYTQMEIRKHLFWKLGAVAFAGAGNTMSSLDSNPSDNLKYVCGFGGRLAATSGTKMNFRLDVGFGSNGDVGVFTTAREAF